MPAKKHTAHRAKKSPQRPAAHRSFKVHPEAVPFYTFQFTRQTVYWLVLVLVIAILQLWILKLQLDISELNDTITTIQLQK